MTNGTTQPPRAGTVSRLAALSLLLSLLSPIVTGLPALAVGFLGLRAVNASDGRLRGRGLAIAGMVAGGLGTVLFVVGLAAWLLPMLRARANRAECQDHLRVLGLALDKYCDDHTQPGQPHYYPYGTVPNERLHQVDQRLSWYVSILPYSPNHALAEKIDQAAAWDAPANRAATSTTLKGLLCPAGTHAQPGPTNYVGIAGLGADAPELTGADDPRAGFFGYDRHTTREAIEAGRGTSQTTMVAETTWQIGPWAQGGFATVRGIDPASKPYLGPGRPFGGLHPGGAYLLFADGSVSLVSDGIVPRVFEAHATVRGK